MVIAHFGPNSGEFYAGRRLEYDDGAFLVADVGIVTAEQVAAFDAAGQLVWTSEDTGQWARALGVPRGPTITGAVDESNQARVPKSSKTASHRGAYQFGRFVGRHKVALVTASAALVIVAALVVSVYFFSVNAMHPVREFGRLPDVVGLLGQSKTDAQRMLNTDNWNEATLFEAQLGQARLTDLSVDSTTVVNLVIDGKRKVAGVTLVLSRSEWSRATGMSKFSPQAVAASVGAQSSGAPVVGPVTQLGERSWYGQTRVGSTTVPWEVRVTPDNVGLLSVIVGPGAIPSEVQNSGSQGSGPPAALDSSSGALLSTSQSQDLVTVQPPVGFAAASQQLQRANLGAAWFPTRVPQGYVVKSIETTSDGGQNPVVSIVFQNGARHIYLTQGSPVGRDYEIPETSPVRWSQGGAGSVHRLCRQGESG